MSIGSYPSMSLKEARMRRNEAAAMKEAGIDPIAARDAAGVSTRERSVEAMIEATFEAIRGDLARNGEDGWWMSPLRNHIIPKIGNRDIAEITAIDIRDTLAPVWQKTPVAAEKAIQRLGIAFRHAAAAYPGQVDVSVIANAKVLLGSQAHKVRHIPAMPWQEVPAFFASLNGTPASLALKLAILTAARSGSVRQAHIDEFDGDIWTIPAAKMKGGIAFRVPLTDQALEVVEYAKPMARDGFLFIGTRAKPLSDMALSAVLKRRDLPYRPHGFRSSFRD